MITILLGSTGAVGRELLECLLSSSKYSQIILPLRNPLKEWENYPLEQREKMKIIKRENFDFLNGTKEELIEILGTNEINSFFNCLGSVTAKGEEELRRIDKTYAIYGSEVCEKLNINHYSMISARGVSTDSCILYMRVKAEAEEEVLKRNVKFIDVFEPGLIKGRANARCGEKFMGCFCTCCYPCVHVKSLAKAIMLFDLKLYDSDDVEKKNINDGYKRIVSNEEILNIVMEK